MCKHLSDFSNRQCHLCLQYLPFETYLLSTLLFLSKYLTQTRLLLKESLICVFIISHFNTTLLAPIMPVNILCSDMMSCVKDSP